jgi:hypothetical protein
MKVKLLKKLKKKFPIKYYKLRDEVKDFQTGELIKGRFVVVRPYYLSESGRKNVHIYCSTKKDALRNRREIIFDELNYQRKRKERQYKTITI